MSKTFGPRINYFDKSLTLSRFNRIEYKHYYKLSEHDNKLIVNIVSTDVTILYFVLKKTGFALIQIYLNILRLNFNAYNKNIK